MPQLNKERLNNYMQAVQRAIGRLSPEQIQTLRIELSPFCMEMTDEEIEEVAKNIMVTRSISEMYEVLDDESTKVARFYFNEGAKLVRDGK